MNIARIKTPRLSLRPFALTDVEEMHQLWLDPGVRKYLWDDETISKEKAREVIVKSIALFNEKGYGLWAASFYEPPAIIGFCGYWYFREPPELEVLYGVSPEFWGNGLATEMAQAMLQFGFQDLGFDKILASADAPNAASFRVMVKAGMRFLKREQQEGRDTIFYAIVRSDFQFVESIQYSYVT